MTESEFRRMLAKNPDLRVAETILRPRRAIPVLVERDALAAQFVALWALLGGPALVPEFRFCERRWKFDFAHLPTQIAIEINGGIYSQGRHIRAAGYLKDREKVNAAQLLGWRVVELGTGQVTPENLEPVIEAIRTETAQETAQP